MNLQWKNYLESNAASLSEQADTCFGLSAPSADCSKYDLSYLGVIRIQGEERETFLQGQLTSDTREISPELSQLSSYCTPKGRMLATMRLVEHQGDWLMILPASRLPAVLKRLQMFVMRSKVSLTDASEEFVCLGVNGDCAASLSDPLPAKPHQSFSQEAFSLVRVDESARFMLIVTVNEAESVWNNLQADAVDTTHWRLLDIEAAIPTVFEETTEAFIPQMTNLQQLDAVSFTKGCYTGQEVVARMQYLGKLKRRMFPVSFESATEYPRGAEVFAAASSSGQGAGKLVDVVKTAENAYKALAVLELSSMESGDLHLGNENGPLLHVGELPYELEA